MMAGVVSFGGLISGLDTSNIVDQLVALRQKQLITPISSRIQTLTTKKTLLESFRGSFQSLLAAADALAAPADNPFRKSTALSSDTSVAMISSVVSESVAAGTYTLSSITQLAQPGRVIFEGVADRSGTTFGTGTISLSVGSGAITTIDIDATNNTLDGIAAAINDANAGLRASIINDGSGATPYRLTLTSTSTGAANTIAQDLSAVLTGLTVDAISAQDENQPKDALFTINGMPAQSSTNSVEGVIPGVTFSLVDTKASGSLTITVEKDTSSIVAKIKAFVTAYNELSKKIKAQYTYNDQTKSVGPLATDSTLMMAQERLHRLMTSPYPQLAGQQYQSLASIGIKANNENALVVDDALLSNALKVNPSSVEALFRGAGSVDGIAKRISDYAEGVSELQTGTLSRTIDACGSSIVTLTSKMSEYSDRLTQYRTKLQKKFNAMETTLARLKAQSDFWNQQTGATNTLTMSSMKTSSS